MRLKDCENDIRKDYSLGETIERLAGKYGVSTKTIRKCLLGWDGYVPVKKLRVSENAPVDEQLICADYLSGFSAVKVAYKHHLGVGRVLRILKHSGVTPRVPGSSRGIYARMWMDRESIRERLFHGETSAILSKDYGCCSSYFSECLRRLNMAWIPAKVKLENSRVPGSMSADIIHSYSSGYSLEYLAGKHGVSYDVVRRILDASGVKRSIEKGKAGKGTGNKGINQEAVCGDYLSGLPATRVAFLHGICARSVLAILRKNGVAPRACGYGKDVYARVFKDRESLSKRLLAGEDMAVLAIEYSSTRPYFRDCLKRAGIKY